MTKTTSRTTVPDPTWNRYTISAHHTPPDATSRSRPAARALVNQTTKQTCRRQIAHTSRERETASAADAPVQAPHNEQSRFSTRPVPQCGHIPLTGHCRLIRNECLCVSICASVCVCVCGCLCLSVCQQNNSEEDVWKTAALPSDTSEGRATVQSSIEDIRETINWLQTGSEAKSDTEVALEDTLQEPKSRLPYMFKIQNIATNIHKQQELPPEHAKSVRSAGSVLRGGGVLQCLLSMTTSNNMWWMWAAAYEYEAHYVNVSGVALGGGADGCNI